MAKDKTGPKRAMSAFFFFSQEKRPEVKEAHPDWKVTEVAKKLGEMWKELSEEEKSPYKDLAAKDKERYEEEKDKMGPIAKKSKKAKSESESE